MDQPQDDDANRDSQVPDTNSEQGTPITVKFGSEQAEPVSYQDEEQSTAQDPVMDGVPDGDGLETATMPPEFNSEQMVEEAEHQIEEADPQSTSEELEVVTEEIESAEPTPVFVAPAQSSGGTDPMEQILSENGVEPEQAVADAEQPFNGQESTEEPEIPAGEIESDQEMVNAEVQATEDPSESSEVPEPSSEQSEVPVDQPATEQMPVSVEPNTMAQPESTEDAPTLNSSSSDSGAMISDVIVPTAVAAAVATGSSGANAITGTPEPSTIESSQEAMLANQKAQKHHKPKTGKGVLITIVVLVTLLFAGGAVAAYMMSSDKNDETSNTTDTSQATDDEALDENDTTNSTTTSRPGDKVEATALDDYKAACGTGGLVTNATAYAGASPHQIAMFEKGSDDKYALSLISFKDKTWSADPAKVTSAQLVGCIARKVASEVKLKSCPITDSTTKVTTNVDFYSTKYDVSVVEAKTGKVVTTFENSSSSTTCPTTAVYNKADPKIFAGFDLITLEASIKDSVTKAL